MIRDRIVIGIRDIKLSERLQLDPKLTLEIAVTSARQAESVHQQQSLLRGEEMKQSPSIGSVRAKRRRIVQKGSQPKEGTIMVVQLELLHVLAVGNHHLTMSSPVRQKMLYAGSVGNEDITSECADLPKLLAYINNHVTTIPMIVMLFWEA